MSTEAFNTTVMVASLEQIKSTLIVLSSACDGTDDAQHAHCAPNGILNRLTYSNYNTF